MENLNRKFRQFISYQQNSSVEEEVETSLLFKYDGLYYVLETFDDDPYYFRILLPNILDISNQNMNWIDQEINTLALNTKIARLVKRDDKVFAIADGLAYSSQDINHLFRRTLSCLQTIYKEFKDAYLKYKE